MAKAKRVEKTKKKEKSMSYYGINIKVRSDKREINESVYDRLFKRIFEIDYTAKLSGEKAIAINTQVASRYTYKAVQHPALHGRFIRYMILEGSHWYNRGARTVENYVTPEGYFPNAVEIDYIFVPAAHRLFYRTSGKITNNMVLQFIEEAFSEVIEKDEDLKVSLITSHDFIDTIIESKGLQSLQVNISYTNDDLGEVEYDAWMDGLLKEAHAGEFDVSVKPDATGVIQTESPIIQGILGVAKENGSAQARIILPDGGTKTIKTQQYPRITAIKVSENDEPAQVLFIDIMDKYRNKDE